MVRLCSSPSCLPLTLDVLGLNGTDKSFYLRMIENQGVLSECNNALGPCRRVSYLLQTNTMEASQKRGPGLLPILAHHLVHLTRCACSHFQSIKWNLQ